MVAEQPQLEALTSYRALLANRNYRIFFVVTLGSSLGDWAGLFALQILVNSLAQGSDLALFSLGGVMMARLLPSLVVGPLAGVIADRYDRKRLMVVCDVVRGLLFIGVAFSNDILALLALTFIIECLSLMFGAAKDASLPRIIDRRLLQEGNQLNLLATYGPLPFGALLPAVVAEIGGIEVALLANAAALLLSAALLTGLRIPGRGELSTAPRTRGLLAELREGVAFVAELPLIRSLVIGVAGVFVGGGVVVALGPVFVSDALNRPGTDWSWLASVVGGGVAVGILTVRYVTRFAEEKAKVFPWGLALTGALAAVMGTMSSWTLILTLGFAMGIAVGATFVIGYTLLHESTPDEVRGKTFAAFFTVTRVSLFTALALAPLIAGALGTVLFFAAGVRLVLSGVRAAIVLGGLVALLAAVSAGRGIYRAMRHPARPSRLLQRLAAAPPGGIFIAFEGVEGSGKTTQVVALAASLRAEGREVLTTREPGGTPVAERVREVLLAPSSQGMHPRTEALLYAAARTEHLYRVVMPALERGEVVVSDRFLDSSLAYQGFGRQLGPDEVFEVNRWAIDGVLPHVVVLLTLDPEEGLRRAAGRRGRAATDRIEAEELAFHRRVAEGYAELARSDHGRFVVVDAGGDPEAVARAVRLGLRRWLPLPEEQGERQPGSRRRAHGSHAARAAGPGTP